MASACVIGERLLNVALLRRADACVDLGFERDCRSGRPLTDPLGVAGSPRWCPGTVGSLCLLLVLLTGVGGTLRVGGCGPLPVSCGSAVSWAKKTDTQPLACARQRARTRRQAHASARKQDKMCVRTNVVGCSCEESETLARKSCYRQSQVR
jgi:hypothetical protein